MHLRKLVCLMAGPLMALGGASRAWGTESYYGALRLLPAKDPGVYLEFTREQMRLATSREALRTAPWTRVAKVSSVKMDSGESIDSYQFPEVVLPRGAADGSGLAGAEIRVTFALSLRRQGNAKAETEEEPARSFWCDCRVRKRDESGALWTFGIYADRAVSDRARWDAGNTAWLPDTGALRLRLEAKVEGHKAGLGVRVMAAGDPRTREMVVVRDLQKDGKSAPASIEVRDTRGKLVHQKAGDLATFGFT